MKHDRERNQEQMAESISVPRSAISGGARGDLPLKGLSQLTSQQEAWQSIFLQSVKI